MFHETHWRWWALLLVMPVWYLFDWIYNAWWDKWAKLPTDRG